MISSILDFHVLLNDDEDNDVILYKFDTNFKYLAV